MSTSAILPALLLSVSLCAASGMEGCASVGRLSTPSGRPEITIPRSLFKRASVAIASYNLAKGRELDRTTPSQLVTYEAVHGPDGALDVTSKYVYSFVPKQDSVTITSQKLMTEDLDEENPSEAGDQPSLDAEQQELLQIATLITNPSSADIDTTTTLPLGSGDRTR